MGDDALSHRDRPSTAASAQGRRELLERESAFRRRDLATHVNDRKKAGLLASVDAEARRMSREAEDLALASERLEPASLEEIGAGGVAP